MTKEQEIDLRKTAQENLDKINALPKDDPGYKAAESLGLISWYENLLHDLDPTDPNMSEQERDLKEAMGTNDNASENESYEAYQSREDVPEQARELWDIFHNDDALKSMKRGTGDEL